MSNGPQWCGEIKSLAGNRNVVLVEGRMDQYVVERWLELRGSRRPLVFAVGPQPPAAEAGGYHRVIQGLRYYTRQKADGLIDAAITW